MEVLEKSNYPVSLADWDPAPLNTCWMMKGEASLMSSPMASRIPMVWRAPTRKWTCVRVPKVCFTIFANTFRFHRNRTNHLFILSKENDTLSKTSKNVTPQKNLFSSRRCVQFATNLGNQTKKCEISSLKKS